MPTMYFNHLDVTGPAEAVEGFKNRFRINGEMIDVDDGAEFHADNPDSYDEDQNYKNHQGFIDVIWNETKTRFDRIRLRRIANGLDIGFDSWGGHAVAHVSWMAEMCPTLKFSLVCFNDPHTEYEIVFDNGRWEATELYWTDCCGDPDDGDYDDVLKCQIGAGQYEDYSDFKLGDFDTDKAVSLNAIR